MPLFRSLVFLGLLVFAVAARAHDPGLSSTTVTRFNDRVELVTTFATVDAEGFLTEDGSGVSPPHSNAALCSELARLAPSLWQLLSGQTPLAASSTEVKTTDGNNVVFIQHYFACSGESLDFSSAVFALLPPGHRQHASVLDRDGKHLFSRLLSRTEPGFALPRLSAPPATSEAIPPALGAVKFTEFLRLGIQHILTGYDHLLFLFAFLLTARDIRAVFKIVTSFTLAHSLTLSLSALDIVVVPAGWVEPLIAASILWVALQNLFKRGQTKDRVGLTFAFGLIHGFGFASVLRDLGISSLGTSAWRALAGFNLGVELGQIAVATAVFPVLWYLRSRKSYETSWAPVASSVIALAGAYWLVERLS